LRQDCRESRQAVGCGPCSGKGLRGFVRSKLGRCLFCIRLSAAGTLAGWAMFALTGALYPVPPVLGFALLLAAGFTLLLLAHMLALMARSLSGVRIASAREAGRGQASSVSVLNAMVSSQSRRSVLRQLCGGLKTTTVAILTPGLVSAHHAPEHDRGCIGGCASPEDRCCRGRCTNIVFDRLSCGRCGNACPSGYNCCGGSCVNVSGNDLNNCGCCGCGCLPGQICLNGACA
jgi:hypothetical protein